MGAGERQLDSFAQTSDCFTCSELKWRATNFLVSILLVHVSGCHIMWRLNVLEHKLCVVCMREKILIRYLESDVII